ncbi:MAG: hypothetical protein JWR24_1580 [Actinoallomurus sp.]|nr:hypothetical protein [Actinoallomurus sp.]
MTDPRTWASPDSGTPEAAPPAPPPQGPPEPAERDELETEIPLRPLGVSEILDGAVTYIRRNPRATLGISAILTSVVQVIITLAQYFVIGSQARAEITPGVLARSLGWLFITVTGGLLLTAHIVLMLGGLLAPVMARTLLGRSTSFGQAWREARPRLPRLLGAATMVMVIVLIAVAVPLVPLVAAVAVGAPTGVAALAWVGGVPAAAVLMVSGYVWFALSAPILVMERRGVFAALRRSAEMVRGRWWRTFGVLVLALVITGFAEFVVLPMPFAVAQRIVLALRPEPRGWTLVAIVAIGALGRIVAGTLVNPFNAGVIAMLYADRRMRREAFDLELQLDPPADPVTAWLPGPLTAAGSVPQPTMPRGSNLTPPAPPGPPPPGWHR